MNSIVEVDQTNEVALVMEYAKYGTLEDFLETDSPFCQGKIVMKEETVQFLIKDVSKCLNFIY